MLTPETCLGDGCPEPDYLARLDLVLRRAQHPWAAGRPSAMAFAAALSAARAASLDRKEAETWAAAAAAWVDTDGVILEELLKTFYSRHRPQELDAVGNLVERYPTTQSE